MLDLEQLADLQRLGPAEVGGNRHILAIHPEAGDSPRVVEEHLRKHQPTFHINDGVAPVAHLGDDHRKASVELRLATQPLHGGALRIAGVRSDITVFASLTFGIKGHVHARMVGIQAREIAVRDAHHGRTRRAISRFYRREQ